MKRDGALELLDRAVGYTLGSLAAVRDEHLRAPTPCAAWTVWDLLRHMNDSLCALSEGLGAQTITARTVAADEDLVQRLKLNGCRLLGHCARSLPDEVLVCGAPLPGSALVTAGALEITVHGWDLARGCGLGHDIPEELARALLPGARMFVGDADRPERFGPALPWQGGAREKLLGHLGRHAQA